MSPATATKQQTRDRIADAAIIAVIRASTPAGAMAAAEAAVLGGIRAIEFTFTTPDVLSAIREFRAIHQSDAVVGAGTVLGHADADAAVDAGAEFLVSPGSAPAVVGAMLATGVLTMGGALTPTEVIAAQDAGVDLVKVFPAQEKLRDVRAWRTVFPRLEFIPTGGIGVRDVEPWLAAGALAVGVGGELAPLSEIDNGRFNEISVRAMRFVSAAKPTNR